jgi:hypothetical protein
VLLRPADSDSPPPPDINSITTCPPCVGPSNPAAWRVEHTVHDATAQLRELLLDRPLDNDEVEWQGGRVYLHLGARRDDRPRG